MFRTVLILKKYRPEFLPGPERTKKMRKKLLILLATICAIPMWEGVQAQDHAGDVWVLPIETDFDFGAQNGDAIISRAIPVNSLYVGDNWRLINLAMITVADAPGGTPGFPGNPDPIPGPKVFGLGDLTDAVLYTSRAKSGLMWGAGIALNIPIATDDNLGSGKWQAGPALRLGYQGSAWRFGLLAANRWSFAGKSSRADVNQFLARLFIRRDLGSRWFFVSSPIITANWNGGAGQKWLVPLGAGFGRGMTADPVPIDLSLQFYSNIIKPDGAPDWVVRFGLTFPFQLPD